MKEYFAEVVITTPCIVLCTLLFFAWHAPCS